MQSCDTCRRRKIKCDRTQPCLKCRVGLLTCTYHDNIKRQVTNLRIPAAGRPPASVRSSPITQDDARSVQQAVEDVSGQSEVSSGTGSCTSLPRHGHSIARSASPTARLKSADRSSRVSSRLLRLHIKLFLKWIFPLWPIVRPQETLAACSNVELLSQERYCFLVALCAATNTQLNLAPPSSVFDSADTDDQDTIDTGDFYPPSARDYLLREAVSVQKTLDIASSHDIDTMLTSCFLFSAYANQERHKEAWFYLSQAVSFAVSLRLHDESTYTSLDPQEAELKRRIFYLTFIFERAYSLHLKCPVVLHSTIQKPTTTFDDDPAPIDAFLGILSVFEALPPDLYNWLCIPRSEMQHQAGSVPVCYWSLSNTVLSPNGALEPQLVNIWITQQWLRSFLWHTAFRLRLPDTVFMAASLPLETPLSAAKSVMETLATVSPRSLEIHGVGMERKLFDLGTYILDFTECLPLPITRVASSNPKELLWGILISLSKIRGATSFLLPSLLERSKKLLAVESPWQPGLSVPETTGEEREIHEITDEIYNGFAGHEEVTYMGDSHVGWIL
ncbi:hypothetical protein PV05_08131 [Exophiala xenobiotica]|uniref:Zn(2)-C6 fungal-type domain-containing protein n=1 Tax=Exophiala xenobiotica TaxID=348802 RepID=A0A0D2EXI6_9EURO|nr:uncharacterized protein PV05_08131 [Exophiala xenobiotica]KIW52499.1 hypothetical protein PV05_08131 [Exophiala xenobiotica]